MTFVRAHWSTSRHMLRHNLESVCSNCTDCCWDSKSTILCHALIQTGWHKFVPRLLCIRERDKQNTKTEHVCDLPQIVCRSSTTMELMVIKWFEGRPSWHVITPKEKPGPAPYRGWGATGALLRLFGKLPIYAKEASFPPDTTLQKLISFFKRGRARHHSVEHCKIFLYIFQLNNRHTGFSCDCVSASLYWCSRGGHIMWETPAKLAPADVTHLHDLYTGTR